MIELLSMFLTGGGSAALGSILKGVFGAIADGREQKFKLELQKENARAQNNLNFQKALLGTEEESKYVRGTRRLLGLIGMLTLSTISILCTIYPQAELLTLAGAGQDPQSISILFGLFDFPQSSDVVKLTTGHIAVFAATVVYPMIVGFYFTPGGRR